MKTILVPTDFSATADKALMVAKDLAKKTNAKIHLANFYSIPVIDYSHPGVSMPGELLEAIRKSAEEGISELTNELKAEGLEVDATIEMGMATDEIVELAKKQDVDLVVMGTTGEGGVLNILIGSNASNVMTQTEKPIILVPKDYVFEGIQGIVYADSLHEDDTAVLKQLFEFAEKIGAEHVNILNINTSHHYEPLQDALVLKLKKVFGVDKVKMNFIEADNIKEGIDKYLEFHSIDLVVMSRHKKTLLERIFSSSNTKMMALYSKVPLMVYHK